MDDLELHALHVDASLRDANGGLGEPRPRAIEAMDACRSGHEHDDLSAPELAPLAESLAADPTARRAFDRLQRLDGRIRAAVCDVAAPAGLNERILKRVRESCAAPATNSGAPPATVEVAPAGPVEVMPAEVVPPAARRVSRRTWWVAALAASALVAASAVWFWPEHKPLTAAMLVEKGGEWFSQVWNANAWKALPPGERGLVNYPPSIAVRSAANRYADVTEIVGEKACVYDVSVGNRRAVLFVIPSDDPVADFTPPPRPQSSTLGLMIGCWQSQGMVYVLVVDGQQQDYQRLIAPVPQPPLT